MAFTKPTIKEAKDFANTIGFKSFDATKWWHFYESKGWRVGKVKMSSWKSAVWTWFTGSDEYLAMKRQPKPKPQPKTEPVKIATREERDQINQAAGSMFQKVETAKLTDGEFQDKRQEQAERLRNG